MTELLTRVIEKMKVRPGMYLGCASITRLQSYLHGYMEALDDFRVPGSEDGLSPLPFGLLHDFVANKYRFTESTSGWCNMILEQCGGDEARALYTFFDVYHEFIHLKIQSCAMAVLDGVNVEYHYTVCTSYRLLGTNPHRQEPVYIDPREAFVFGLSDGAGFVFVVRTKAGDRISMNIHRSKRACEWQLRSYFGEMEWHETDANGASAAIRAVRRR